MIKLRDRKDKDYLKSCFEKGRLKGDKLRNKKREKIEED